MFGGKDSKESGQPAEPSGVDVLSARLGALSLADLAHEVMTALVEATAAHSVAARSQVVEVLDPSRPGTVSPSTIMTDGSVRRLHILVAEGLQALENANLVCLVDVHVCFYALTRLGEDAVARGAVLQILQTAHP